MIKQIKTYNNCVRILMLTGCNGICSSMMKYMKSNNTAAVANVITKNRAALKLISKYPIVSVTSNAPKKESHKALPSFHEDSG